MSDCWTACVFCHTDAFRKVQGNVPLLDGNEGIGIDFWICDGCGFVAMFKTREEQKQK